MRLRRNDRNSTSLGCQLGSFGARETRPQVLWSAVRPNRQRPVTSRAAA
jgi:hypothetical protein